MLKGEYYSPRSGTYQCPVVFEAAPAEDARAVQARRRIASHRLQVAVVFGVFVQAVRVQIDRWNQTYASRSPLGRRKGLDYQANSSSAGSAQMGVAEDQCTRYSAHLEHSPAVDQAPAKRCSALAVVDGSAWRMLAEELGLAVARTVDAHRCLGQRAVAPAGQSDTSRWAALEAEDVAAA